MPKEFNLPQEYIDNWEKYQGRPRCCDQDYGGSHYHCANCGEVSSMMGHMFRYPGEDDWNWKCEDIAKQKAARELAKKAKGCSVMGDK